MDSATRKIRIVELLALVGLDQWGDGVFASFGLGPEEIAELRKRFADWPRP